MIINKSFYWNQILCRMPPFNILFTIQNCNTPIFYFTNKTPYLNYTYIEFINIYRFSSVGGCAIELNHRYILYLLFNLLVYT